MNNNQASKELKTKPPVKMRSKNITFHNHIMTNHIFGNQNVYFDVMFLYVNNTSLLCIFFKLYADKYFQSSKTGLGVLWPSR